MEFKLKKVGNKGLIMYVCKNKIVVTIIIIRKAVFIFCLKKANL